MRQCDHDHAVAFYEKDGALAHAVVAFAAAGLRDDGDAFILVATPEHRTRIERALRAEGVDLDAAVAAGRFAAHDAAGTLARLMGPDGPDPGRYRATIAPLIEAASAAAPSGTVRVFGEMVALLYAARDVASAIALEDLWNDLAGTHDFRLLCAYPMSAFEDPGSRASFERICEQHTAVAPAESFPVPASAPGDDAGRRAVAGLQQRLVVLESDVARLRRDRRELADLAYLDALTGLANRRAFDRDLAREHALARRAGVDSFVVVADLDGFKRLNDRAGHAAGDAVLRAFAGVLHACARETDVVARVGGDEFGVLLVRCSPEAATRFAAAVQERMGCGPLVSVSASLGAASLGTAASADLALEAADLAMFTAKRLRAHP